MQHRAGLERAHAAAGDDRAGQVVAQHAGVEIEPGQARDRGADGPVDPTRRVHVDEAGGDVLMVPEGDPQVPVEGPVPPDVLVDEADAHAVLGAKGEGSMLRPPARWAGTLALLVAVALIAFATAGGIQLPARVPVTPAEDPCRAPLRERAVGIAPGSEWKRDPRAPEDMTQMAAMGVRWIRLGFEWAVIEPKKGQFKWESVDRIVREASSTCLAVLAMVGTTPQWARRDGCPTLWCPPRDPADFAGFVTAVAERYGQDVRAWEVWNEPNHASWFRPRPDPKRYGDLLTAAARAIRATVPDATVLSGGVAPSPRGDPRRMLPDRFLDEVYRTGAMDLVDGVAYHPYSIPNLPSERTGNNGWADQLPAFRKVMVDHGDADERVWLTEFGFPTPGGAQATLARQEEMVVDAFGLWRSLDYAGPFFWFAWRDPEAGSADPQRNFGLRFNDDRAKPAFGVFDHELRP